MPAPIKYPKDPQGLPTGPSETAQVKALLNIEDRPPPGPGKKPIQHPTYKQLRDAIVASAKQRAVYSVKDPGYVDMLKDLVYGSQVPYLNSWIPHWQDRDHAGTEGENFYAHISWLVQDVVKNLKAGIKRDRKKEGGEDLSLPQTATLQPKLNTVIHSSPPPSITFPISLIVFRRRDNDESPPTLREWSLQEDGVTTTVLTVASPTFSALTAATRRFTDTLHLNPIAFYGLKRPEMVNDVGDGFQALRPTDVVALRMDGQVSGFAAQMEKANKEIVIGVAVTDSPVKEVINTIPHGGAPHRKRSKMIAARTSGSDSAAASEPPPPPPPQPSSSSAALCSRCSEPLSAPRLGLLQPNASPFSSKKPIAFDFHSDSFPDDIRDIIYLSNKLKTWKGCFESYLRNLKNHAESLGLYDQICFADELCSWSQRMTEEQHATEKNIYATCRYSNVLLLENRTKFDIPDGNLGVAINSAISRISGHPDTFGAVYVPETALERQEHLESENEPEMNEPEMNEPVVVDKPMMSFADLQAAHGPLSPPREVVDQDEMLAPFESLDRCEPSPITVVKAPYEPAPSPLSPPQPPAMHMSPAAEVQVEPEAAPQSGSLSPVAAPTNEPVNELRESSSSDITDVEEVAARLPKNYREPTGIRIDALQQDLSALDTDIDAGLRRSNRKRGAAPVSGSRSPSRKPSKRRWAVKK